MSLIKDADTSIAGSSRPRYTTKSSSDFRVCLEKQKGDPCKDRWLIAFAPSPPAIEAAAHIRRPAREPDPRAVRHPHHRAAARTSRSIVPSTIPRTRTHPATRSISIDPSAGAALTLTAANFTGFAARDAS
jgi:hypothetical protein